ncbi:hypothetical protein AMECASPLE_028397 [Ameca splendens]|uniref:Uncharacterized protein n=1 Tax=Ameca splendens TaxID=208324 RepID=A0ABV1AD77_9TELE
MDRSPDACHDSSTLWGTFAADSLTKVTGCPSLSGPAFLWGTGVSLLLQKIRTLGHMGDFAAFHPAPESGKISCILNGWEGEVGGTCPECSPCQNRH